MVTEEEKTHKKKKALKSLSYPPLNKKVAKPDYRKKLKKPSA